jgi:hypothetical protein
MKREWHEGFRNYGLVFKNLRAMLPLLCLISGLLLIPQPVMAQVNGTGALTGVVTDTSGGVVTGAEVTVVSDATGETRTVTSNSIGVYLVPLLPPGTYHVTAQKTGFEVSSYPHVTVVVSETDTANIQLKVGSSKETIVVTATQQMLQTE